MSDIPQYRVTKDGVDVTSSLTTGKIKRTDTGSQLFNDQGERLRGYTVVAVSGDKEILVHTDEAVSA